MNTFKQKVYEIVRKIPPGETMSYKEVAKLAENEKAARAVGNILHNSPSDVPCHRVVSQFGKLAANFGKGGLVKQKELLKKEGNTIENYKIIQP